MEGGTVALAGVGARTTARGMCRPVCGEKQVGRRAFRAAPSFSRCAASICGSADALPPQKLEC